MSEQIRDAIQFRVSGMTCGGCAAKITSSLKKDPRIDSAMVDFVTGSGVLSGSIDPAEVERLISAMGYGFQAMLDDQKTPPDHRGRITSSGTWLMALVLAGPVVVLAMGPWHFSWSGYAQAFLTTVFLVVPASGFFRRAVSQAAHRSVNMDSLVAIGMASAWLLSMVLLMNGSTHLYFESAVMIGFFVLSGKNLESWAKNRAINEVEKLVQKRPKTGFKFEGEDGPPREVMITTFKIGDHIYVRPGDMLPLDAVVLDCEAGFDESVITGESKPVLRRPGELVPAGAINASSFGVKLSVKKIGKDTTIEQIIRLVELSSLSRPTIQKLADQISVVFVPVVIALSALTLIGWIAAGESPLQSLVTALSVLVVACPCALGLATPVAWVAGLGRAAKCGVLVRSYEALETLSKIDTIVFDKTGTLTNGQPVVLRAYVTGDHIFNSVAELIEKDKAELLIGLSALLHSSHPHARSLVTWLKSQLESRDIPSSKLIRDVPGDGVECEVKVNDTLHFVKYGRADFVGLNSDVFSGMNLSSVNSVVALSIDGHLRFVFEMGDALREDALSCLEELMRRSYSVYIASGDRESVIQSLFSKMPLEPIRTDDRGSKGKILYQAEMTPSGKNDFVLSLRKAGSKVAFVGDGMNDAPALAAADVAVAMGSGSDLAASHSGLVLRSKKIGTLLEAIDLSKLTTKIIRQNFFWAFAYNVAAIPLAMMGLMSPMWAAAAMALSSVSVVLNALRLRG